LGGKGKGKEKRKEGVKRAAEKDQEHGESKERIMNVLR